MRDEKMIGIKLVFTDKGDELETHIVEIVGNCQSVNN